MLLEVDDCRRALIAGVVADAVYALYAAQVSGDIVCKNDIKSRGGALGPSPADPPPEFGTANGASPVPLRGCAP